MEIFFTGEALAEQPRATHGSVFPKNQAAVGLFAKERLRDPEYDEGIKPATNHAQNQRGQHRAANVREERFHVSK